MTAAIATLNSGQGSGTAARTITYPTIAAGEHALVVVCWGPAATLTPPTGLTAVPNLPTNGGAANIWAGWVANGAGGTSYSFSVAARDVWFTMRITGGHPTALVNASGSSAVTTSGTSGTSPSVTTTSTDNLIIGILEDYVTATGTAAAWTTPASTTKDASLATTLAGSVRWSEGIIYHDTAAQAAAGATTARTSTGASGTLVGTTIALAPAPATTRRLPLRHVQTSVSRAAFY